MSPLTDRRIQSTQPVKRAELSAIVYLRRPVTKAARNRGKRRAKLRVVLRRLILIQEIFVMTLETEGNTHQVKV